MSNRCQHRGQIYHFTANREFSSSHLPQLSQVTISIGAVTTEVANDDFALLITFLYAAYFRIYDNNSSISLEWERHFRTVYRGVVGK